ncbi:DUF4167 domain-containing protein [Alphaproteobacteria bacterium]|nr:DUF4167 domain-containing protein [Alphaproteobacteria bacterium]
MRHNQGQNSKRARGRGRRSGGHNQVNFNRNTTFDSNGPEGRLRGNAQQLFEKYTALAHDANAAGERISAEAFTQFADHYYRIHQSILQTAEQQRKAHDERQQSRRRDQNGASENASENAGENASENASQAVGDTPPETKADERADASTSEALSDEEAAAGVKKMAAAGRPRKSRVSKKPKEVKEDSAEADEPSDDASEAVA